MSHLAEHTRNLHADPRAGFLVAHAPDGDVLEGQRLTLLGSFEPVAAEAVDESRAAICDITRTPSVIWN